MMQTDDREHLKHDIKNLIRQHVGPANAIKMVTVFVEVTGEIIIPWKRHEQTRPVRELVNQLRNEGCPIGSCRGGYFWARDEKELDGTLAKLHTSAMTSLKTEAALKRISFSQLLKQYEIEFSAEAQPHQPTPETVTP